MREVYLVGSAAAGKAQARDVDLLYVFDEGIKDTEEAVEQLRDIDLKRYNTFAQSRAKYFYLTMGAGRAWVENADNAKEQKGKPRVLLAKRGGTGSRFQLCDSRGSSKILYA